MDKWEREVTMPAASRFSDGWCRCQQSTLKQQDYEQEHNARQNNLQDGMSNRWLCGFYGFQVIILRPQNRWYCCIVSIVIH
jgi:hypothetical protein